MATRAQTVRPLPLIHPAFKMAHVASSSSVIHRRKAKGSDGFNVNVERHTRAKPSLLVKKTNKQKKNNVGGTIWNPDEAAFSK